MERGEVFYCASSQCVRGKRLVDDNLKETHENFFDQAADFSGVQFFRTG
jgi:hypothetical protein